MISSVQSDTLNKIISGSHSQPPPSLYHYTSLEATKNILESKELWASNTCFVNDGKEGFILEPDFIEEIRNIRGKYYSDSVQYKFLWYVELAISAYSLSNRYIISFSADYDDLAQFTIYGSYEVSICIGFDSNLLKSLIFPVQYDEVTACKTHLTKCYYISKKEIEDVIEELCSNLYKLLNKLNSSLKEDVLHSYAAKFVRYFENAKLILKDRSFISENEWRLVLDQTSMPSFNEIIKYRTTHHTLIPYIAISIPFPVKKIIPKIMIGPCQNQMLNKIG